jgi:hypothetical protein
MPKQSAQLQEIYDDTHRFSAERSIFDLKPARTHDLSLDDQQLERRCVGAKDMAESRSSSCGNLRFSTISMMTLILG